MKKRPFSIIEVLIAFTIIGILGAAIAINIQKGATERREKDTIDIITGKLRAASQLAKMTNHAVEVEFIEVAGKHMIFLTPSLKTSDAMKRSLSKKVPLDHVKEIELVPNHTRSKTIEFFPWGIQNRKLKVQVVLDSGKKVTCLPANYSPNVVVSDRTVIEDLFPREILEDEKEEKHVYTN